MSEFKEKYMRKALKEALKGVGKVSPNPLVGALIVKDGRIIGKGHHSVYGGHHAEVNAVLSCREDAAGADMYVTLEPCSHHGKTPPCTDLIIRTGIRKVFIGTLDPSPHSSGRGIKQLNGAGISTETGILETECRNMNRPFFKSLETSMPFITVKVASSLDGSIAAGSGDSKWISCEKSRKAVHKLRNSFDAVLVGKNTVLNDDPLLTVRLCKGRNPVRIMTDEYLSASKDMNIFNSEAETIVITSKTAPKNSETNYKEKGIRIIRVDETEGKLDLEQAFRAIHALGIRSVLAEGGAALISYLLNRKLADRMIIFFAPVLLGSAYKFFEGSGISKVSEAVRLEDAVYRKCGSDMTVEGNLRYS